MFGSIGQPVSGVKDERTARAFLRLLQDQAKDREDKKRRGQRRRQRLVRTVKSWFGAG